MPKPKIVREGIGRGALKQYELLHRHWQVNLPKPVKLYFQAFTRDRESLEGARRQGAKIVARVGGWHFDNAETTHWVLRNSDGAIFVSEYTKELAKKKFPGVPGRRVVIVNSAPQADHLPRADRPYLLVRAGGLGWPIWKKWMLSRSLGIFCLYGIWPQLRERYPNLGLRIRGRISHHIKERIPEKDGIRFLPFEGDAKRLHWEGSRASALVHLVIGDHSPNTVAEIIGEGRPAIVLDKGGAGELAGCAAIPVLTRPSSEHTNLDTWWPYDEKTYRPDLNSLFGAVCDAIEREDHWRGQAKKRAAEISPQTIANQYLKFMRSL